MNLLYSILLLFFLLFTIPVESEDPAASSCNRNETYGSNTKISQNINHLLHMLVSDTIKYGFSNTSYGEKGDQIYGLAQCREDVPKDNCTSCIQDASSVIRDNDHCPNQANATIWYNFCFLRYNTNNFFGNVDTSGWYLYNTVNVTGVDGFKETLVELMSNIKSEATKPDQKGFGKGTRELTPSLTLYGLAQCTKDLTVSKCDECLSKAIKFPSFCDNKKGCRVLFESCYVRFELYPIFFPFNNQTGASFSSGNHESALAIKS